jgi:chemotaxis protein CheD
MSSQAEKSINIIQGDHAVSGEDGVVITTILGSCVATCLYDPVRRIGGANHFLLSDPGSGPTDIRYAAAAIEVLINALLRAGAQKSRLEAKLVGGARMMPNLPDIGGGNALAATRFLSTEGIPIINSDLGGTQARKLRFLPTTGRVQVHRLAHDINAQLEAPRLTKPRIELFD